MADAAFGVESGAVSALLLALLLGLRHATDPDHLAAVATIAADPARRGARAAARLGIAWSLGHAITCLALGVVVMVAGRALPESVRVGAELAVGVLIVALAVRLIARWRFGHFHSHEHRHDDVTHRHPHLHEAGVPAGHTVESHRHGHAEALGRTPLAAFGIGLVHGVGGSALGAALIAASRGDPRSAIGLLVAFCFGTMLAMGGASAVLGRVLDRTRGAIAFERAAPVIGVATLSFGAWYLVATFARLGGAG